MNNQPNGHSHINDRMAQAVRQREAQLRQALGQIQQMSLALKSVSTLAALYKVELKTILEHEEIMCCGNAATEAHGKASKVLAMPHMEPVNEIIKLQKELHAQCDSTEKMIKLCDAQKNMIEQMEREIRIKEDRIAQLELKNMQ
jgi:hypothetical protein